MSTPKGKIVKSSAPKARSIRRRKHARVFYGNLKGQKPSLGLLAATEPATTGLLGVAGKEESSSPTTSGTPVLASCQILQEAVSAVPECFYLSGCSGRSFFCLSATFTARAILALQLLLKTTQETTTSSEQVR